MMARSPDFVCVGAQKAATSWLYNALRWVPGVFLPAIKELHYFSELCSVDARGFGPKHRASQIREVRVYHEAMETRSPFAERVLAQLDHLESDTPSDDWYRGIFGFAQEQDVCGEVCPSYMSMPERGVQHVQRISPEVRVLMIVRDPVDRAWSHMRMHTKNGTLDLGSILAEGVTLSPYLLYTDYARSIPRWKGMARDGHFRAIEYDRIEADPHAVLSEVLEFIGAPGASPKANLSQSVFSGDKVELPPELRDRLLAELEPQYDFLHTVFPERVEAWAQRHRAALVS